MGMKKIEKARITIIIPTFNNAEYLIPCINSIVQTGILRSGLAKLIVVDNGTDPLDPEIKEITGTKVVKTGKNLGWEGGLKEGLKHVDTEFVVFQNDDTFIPIANRNFYHQLMSYFIDPLVGAVGPSTTVAMGPQSIFAPTAPNLACAVKFLIFFTVMVRMSDLERAGGIDDSLPGGDDLDLSIRLRKLGQRLVLNPDAFLIHHAFKTGTRVHGDANVKDGWNSESMTEKTHRALIQKHGFRSFFDLFQPMEANVDSEGNMIREIVKTKNAPGEMKIVELGCGATKTVPEVIGVDRIKKGEQIPFLAGAKSVADVIADVQKELPEKLRGADIVIARHILEHCLDLNETLEAWGKIVKEGGWLIIAVPEENMTPTIPMNPEHVHAFTRKSLAGLLTHFGFFEVESNYSGNGVSFVGVYEKVAL